MSGVKAKGSKPWWWKPLWIAVLLITIASGVVGYLLLSVPLERIAGGVALTFLCIGIAYYIRVRPSMKVNRAIYILFGITPIGFGLWILLAISGVGRFLNYLPWSLALFHCGIHYTIHYRSIHRRLARQTKKLSPSI